METQAVAVPQDPKLVEFNKMKAAIDNQVNILNQIKVTDDTSLAVANQQLSAAKLLDKQVDNAHAIVKEEALRFCQAADKARRDMKAPLAPATTKVEQKVLNYNTVVEKKKQAALAELAAKEEALRNEEAQNQQRLAKQMLEFEARAFKLINEAADLRALSFVYTTYVIAFPPVYDPKIKERVKALGTAKKEVIEAQSDAVKQIKKHAYDAIWNEFTATEQVPAVAPAAMPMPSFGAIEQKRAEIESMGVSNIKKDWDYDVIDMTKVPVSFLIIDEKVVKQFMKDNKEKLTEGMEMHGLRFKTVASVKTK